MLITLGIIGVVAAMTLPGLIQNYQKMVLKNQFKKTYSQFLDAAKLTQSKSGAPIGCYYWDKSPYSGGICVAYNEYGSCTKWTLADGSPLPADYSGNFKDCRSFYEEFLGKTLMIIKYCPNHALANGCITEHYRGLDKIKAEQNPEVEPDPNMLFSDSVLKNTSSAWILKDGTLIMLYTSSVSGRPIFLIDINGHKSPNKWGYDIFTFRFSGNLLNGITTFTPVNYTYEKGGFSSTEMFLEAFHK